MDTLSAKHDCGASDAVICAARAASKTQIM
jgi:hypothetical protein